MFQLNESSVFSLESALSHIISLYGPSLVDGGSQNCSFMHTCWGGGREGGGRRGNRE